MNLKLWNKTIKFCQNYNFLMFEIVLALLVIMVGAFGVSSMFPVGMSSQKEAVGSSYVTDAAEQLLRLNVSYIRNDWDWLNVFANAKPGTNDQGREWNFSALFQVNSLRVKADAAFDANSDSNSGLFLLEQMTLNQVDHTAIVRLWKDVTENDNGSYDAKIYAEVSWPADKPYYAREKEVFSLQVSKAPEISIASAAYSSNCAVTRDHGAGYSTTIASVVDNGDSTYTIELVVEHDGCSGSICPELSHYSVEAEEYSYSDVSFFGISGTLDLGYTLSDDPFGGFKVDYTSGIGNGTAGIFIVEYTLTSLQDQEMVAHGGGNAYSVSFTAADFDYVLSCTNQGSNFTAAAEDDVYTVDIDDGDMSAMSGGNNNVDYSTLTVPAPGILVNDTTSDGSELTAVLVAPPAKGTLTLNPDGSFIYVPGSNFNGNDGFTYKAFSGTKLTNVARAKIDASVIGFDIVDGEVIPTVDYEASIKVLGAAITYGGSYHMPVTVKAEIDGTTIEPWGSFTLPVDGNVNIGTQQEYNLPDTYSAGTPISVTGQSWVKADSDYSGTSNSHWTQEIQVNSASGSSAVLVLRDGDDVPDITPFQDQGSIVSFLQGYIDNNQKVVLDDNQAIFLYELGTTNLSSSAADFQDLVILVTLQ